MRLISIDPVLLKPNPHNPRRTAAPALSDQQLTVNIAEVGLLQPPLVRDTADGMTIVAGQGRRSGRACPAGWLISGESRSSTELPSKRHRQPGNRSFGSDRERQEVATCRVSETVLNI